MIGALAGDIIGSIYEWNNIKTTEFELFQSECHFTDDTVLTVALADSIVTNASYNEKLREYYSIYPDASYGKRFHKWAKSRKPKPYSSFGNGSAMRISPVGWAYQTLDDVMRKAEEFSIVTHNHPEGIKGAQATAASIFMARHGAAKDEIKQYVTARPLTMTLP